MKLDARSFSKEAYEGLTGVRKDIKEEYYKKASGLVRGLPAYISTWGLHRLSGDAKNFLAGKSSDTKYKGTVYITFLSKLKAFSKQDFDVENPGTLIKMHLREYTALNRLAIELAKEWSFWTPSILGEPEEE
ncbi:hypothetical protein [Candidatus Cyanaurora vandensis]|uniref:hypothetical protein n=1 Tax=Candidatus Cyanaurora vandensis TaxID=2714958 RepID=UPI00257D78B2|nr:hypothetical protein [Candidatus Cyanaurora vandensis]